MNRKVNKHDRIILTFATQVRSWHEAENEDKFNGIYSFTWIENYLQ